MVEKTLREAVKAFRRRSPGGPDTSRLSSLLDDLERLMNSPGQAEAQSLTREPEPQMVTEQPLPTGQIPDPSRKEFSATN